MPRTDDIRPIEATVKKAMMMIVLLLLLLLKTGILLAFTFSQPTA